MHQPDTTGDTDNTGFEPEAAERPDKRRHNRRRVIDELRGEQTVELGQQALDAVNATRPAVKRGRESEVTSATAFLYVRVSTREQARTGGGEEGYSIPAQRTAGTDKARQLEAVVTGVYIDAGESAKTAQRPELQRLLQDVKAQRPTYVIVHKIDRLARNREDDMPSTWRCARPA